jgi:hypothetical protein
MRVDGVGYSPAALAEGLAAGDAGGPQAGRAFMAAALQQAFARGEYENVHEVIIAAQEAGIALDLVLAIRNQVVRAYEEIMRMQM